MLNCWCTTSYRLVTLLFWQLLYFWWLIQSILLCMWLQIYHLNWYWDIYIYKAPDCSILLYRPQERGRGETGFSPQLLIFVSIMIETSIFLWSKSNFDIVILPSSCWQKDIYLPVFTPIKCFLLVKDFQSNCFLKLSVVELL